MKGKIEEIEQREKQDGSSFYRLKISGRSYSLFDEALLQGVGVGDSVQFNYDQNGKYRNLRTLEKVDGYPTSGGKDKNPTLVKLSCLRSAVELLSGSKLDTEKKLAYSVEIAKEFEKYALGGGNVQPEDQGGTGE